MSEYHVNFVRVNEDSCVDKRYPIANVEVAACNVAKARCEAAVVLLTGKRKWSEGFRSWLQVLKGGNNPSPTKYQPWKANVYEAA
jgi:hypothetical protein